MNANGRKPQPDFRQLYSAYQEAWKQFCVEVGVLQSLSPDTADGALESARNRVARAENFYREKRNQLTEYMIASYGASLYTSRPAGKEAGKPRIRRFQLEQLAYEFWQKRGRQGGNAEEDWYRAEALLTK